MKKTLLLAFLLPIALAGCEKYDRYINTCINTQCCGISDPMSNIPWLREKNQWLRGRTFFGTSELDVTLLLYANEYTAENKIVEWQVSTPDDMRPWITIYDCAGEYIDEGEYNLHKYESINVGTQRTEQTKSSRDMPPQCDSCPQFFSTHTLIDTLAQYKVTKQ